MISSPERFAAVLVDLFLLIHALIRKPARVTV